MAPKHIFKVGDKVRIYDKCFMTNKYFPAEVKNGTKLTIKSLSGRIRDNCPKVGEDVNFGTVRFKETGMALCCTYCLQPPKKGRKNKQSNSGLTLPSRDDWREVITV